MPQKTIDLQQKVNELQKAPVNSTTNARYLYRSLNPQVNQPIAHSSGYSPAQHTINQQALVKQADEAALTSSQYPTQQPFNAQISFESSQVTRKLNELLSTVVHILKFSK